MSVYIPKSFNLPLDFQSEVQFSLCYSPYLLFCYFRSGFYQIWNLKLNKLEIYNHLADDIIYLAQYSERCIIFLTRKGNLKIANIFDISLVMSFEITLPTQRAKIESQQTGSLSYLEDLLISSTQILNFKDSGDIVIVEQLRYSNSPPFYYKQIISLYKPISSSLYLKQIITTDNSQLKISPLDDQSKAILWSQHHIKDSNNGKFSIFLKTFDINDNMSSEMINKIMIPDHVIHEEEALPIIVCIRGIDQGKKIVIFENNEQIPVIKIANLEKNKFERLLRLDNGIERGFLLRSVEIYGQDLNRKSNKVGITFASQVTDLNNMLYLYNMSCDQKTVRKLFAIKQTNEMEFIMSDDGNIIVEIDDLCTSIQEEIKEKKCELKIILHRRIPKKILFLFVIKKYGLVDLYSPYLIHQLMRFIVE